MTRIAACLVIICAPCPVLRAPTAPVPVGVVVTFGPAPVVSTPRPAQVTKTALRPLVARMTVIEPYRTHRPVRAVRATLHPRKPNVFTDAPHTHAGLVAWSRTLPWPWPAIIGCESLRDDSWRVGSASHARGILQFLPSTWRSLGLSGDPAAYSWRYQFKAALRLRARDGLGAWDCARILGLT